MSEQEVNELTKNLNALAIEVAKIGERNEIRWEDHKEQSDEKWSALDRKLTSICNKIHSTDCVKHGEQLQLLDTVAKGSYAWATALFLAGIALGQWVIGQLH